MSEQWDYQLRIDSADELAAMARRDPRNPAIRLLMKCQFDAFVA